MPTVEHRRLEAERGYQSHSNWKRWGPYLSERQWGTVREDYSGDGEAWDSFTHEDARSRVYRWGEDGLLGWCDRQSRLCFAPALWNGKDPILKERLFGLANREGNHGEDVKESYHYLASTPTHSYARALYRYPQTLFPYDELRQRNRERGYGETEYELEDTGVFDEGRYFSMEVEYAKAGPEDIIIRLHLTNHGPETAQLHVLGQWWFRNTWSWGDSFDAPGQRPEILRGQDGTIHAHYAGLGDYQLEAEPFSSLEGPTWLFTENETNTRRLYGTAPSHGFAHVKDAFHDTVVQGKMEAVNPDETGTKAAAWYRLHLDPGETRILRFRMTALNLRRTGMICFPESCDSVVAERRLEHDAFYEEILKDLKDPESHMVATQAYAGLLWSKQFYHYIVQDWLKGDSTQPPPAEGHATKRNQDWQHFFAHDVLSMPDCWEYPWFAAWDLAFHMVPMADIDPDFAKQQLLLLLREWYLHPNGQLPAYEWNFNDVNPPVHAWAVWRVYKISGERGHRDTDFLERAFQKLLMNFTWWVNRKDPHGNHIFSGGFLGLDNIGVFDRSKPLPGGGHLEQADATAWMASYCLTMLSMSLELAQTQPSYEDIASKFFEHFISITDAMNQMGDYGLWNEEDGFYYDLLRIDGQSIPMRIRSMVGLLPLCAVTVLDGNQIDHLPGFRKRMEWFLKYRPDLARHISYCEAEQNRSGSKRLLALPSHQRLIRVLERLLDEEEFLSPYGIRSLSKAHGIHPFRFSYGGQTEEVPYVPGESANWLFGGNSNWRGPVWFPVNYLLIEALEQYHYFYGDSLKVEFPKGSGKVLTLRQTSCALQSRMADLFLPTAQGTRPFQSHHAPLWQREDWSRTLLFHEYFHGDSGRGLGASHQTGWTALVVRMLGPACEYQGPG